MTASKCPDAQPDELIVDQLEGEMAVCERPDGTTVALPRSELPRDLRPGMVLRREGGAYRPDPEREATRRASVRRLWNRLKRR